MILMSDGDLGVRFDAWLIRVDYSFADTPRFLTAASPLTAGIGQLRSPTPAGAPLILAPRMPQVSTSTAAMINPPPLVSPTDSAATGLMYNPYEYPYSLQPTATLVEYPTSIEQTAAGMLSFSAVR